MAPPTAGNHTSVKESTSLHWKPAIPGETGSGCSKARKSTPSKPHAMGLHEETNAAGIKMQRRSAFQIAATFSASMKHIMGCIASS
jgi:pSer/pThr/pTyr-binding forkhead associated (FHA) protein